MKVRFYSEEKNASLAACHLTSHWLMRLNSQSTDKSEIMSLIQWMEQVNVLDYYGDVVGTFWGV